MSDADYVPPSENDEGEKQAEAGDGESGVEPELVPGVDFIPTPEPSEGGVEPREHPTAREFVPTPEPSEPEA